MKYTITAVVTAIAIFFIGFISAKLWYMQPVDNSIQFVWNDDEESIPRDGSAILIEFTDKNTVYIGPLENETDSAEYQFTVTEDSISITDFDRHVGTIKLEGQLKELINKDNLQIMKTINFVQRTYQEILNSYMLLKLRYKVVRFFKTLVNGYYHGYFEVSI